MNKDKNNIIKPIKNSYIWMNGTILFFGITLIIIIAFCTPILYPMLGSLYFGFLAGFIVLFFIMYLFIIICYKKEKYEILDDKIVYKNGTIFSDNTVEVNFDRITQVSAKLGFIENIFFKTGSIILKTAGASSSVVILKNVNKPIQIYEFIQEKMRKNGFHLKKDNLVQEARPHVLGVIGELIGLIVFVPYLLISTGILSIGSFVSSSDFGPKSLENIGFYVYICIISLVIFIILVIIFRFLDLKKRKYDVYTDCVVYNEGFLTKHFSVLPMEKITNISNRQGILSRIFGIHDIIVSSEGTSNEVVFKNMKDGNEMINNIKFLKDKITLTKSEVKMDKDNEFKAKKNDSVGYFDMTEKDEFVDYNKDFTGTFYMDKKRVWVLSIFWLIVLFFVPYISIPYIILYLITAYNTKFVVGKSMIEYKFDFLRKKYNAFTVDKITRINITQGITDLIFGTCSIIFYSIGSGNNIVFTGVKKTPNLEKDILSKVGINIKEDFEEIKPNFSFANYFKSSIFASIFKILILIGIIVVLAFTNSFIASYLGSYFSSLFTYILILPVILVIIYLFAEFFYQKLVYFTKRYFSQRIYKNYFYIKEGFIYRSKSYALKKNVKGIDSIKFPLTSTGNLVFHIAGENISNGENGQKIIVQNDIKFKFVKKVFDYHDEIEDVLLKKKVDRTLVKSYKMALINSIFWVTLFYITMGILLLLVYVYLPSIVYAVFLLVAFLHLGSYVWYVSMVFYNLEKERIVVGKGIIYKKRTSILYNKINFCEKYQGFAGKIFGNGNVFVYTVGSGTKDLTIWNVKEFEELYNSIKM